MKRTNKEARTAEIVNATPIELAPSVMKMAAKEAARRGLSIEDYVNALVREDRDSRR